MILCPRNIASDLMKVSGTGSIPRCDLDAQVRSPCPSLLKLFVVMYRKDLIRLSESRVMHKWTKQRKRNRLSYSNNTIRLASIVQTSVTRGRSTFVEMRATSDLVYYNINLKIKSLRFRINNTKYLELRSILHAFLRGYEHILSSNGSNRLDALGKLLAIDSDIVLQLGIIEINTRKKEVLCSSENIQILKELINDRTQLLNG
jgi:hypothetical protein